MAIKNDNDVKRLTGQNIFNIYDKECLCINKKRDYQLSKKKGQRIILDGNRKIYM